MEAPDLWAETDNSSAILGGLEPEAGNSSFTVAEQAEISIKLDSVAESIKKTHELTAEQIKKLDEKVEELKKDSKRLGRKDWKNIVIAQFFSLVITDTITPGVFQNALMLLEHAIGYLYGGAPIGGALAKG